MGTLCGQKKDIEMVEAGSDEEDVNAAVYERILAVIQSGRVAPGQRMPEPAIARALAVSRERVRRALHRLAHEGWLELAPNRGACVPSLDDYELLKVFEARRVLEAAAVRLLAERPSRAALIEIEAHLAAECEAAERRDRRRQIELSGAFHEKLFDLIDNPWLLGFFRQVQVPTVAAYALQAPQHLPDCGGPSEHIAIFEAIVRRDAEEAVRLMDRHLDEGMAHIRRYRRPRKVLAIEEAFGTATRTDAISQPREQAASAGSD